MLLVFWASLFLAIDTQCLRVHANFYRIAEAEKGVTCKPLATLNALKKKTRIQRRQFQICGDWGVQISGYVEGCLHIVYLRGLGPLLLLSDGKKKPIPDIGRDGLSMFFCSANS